jgi:hypothetical protein
VVTTRGGGFDYVRGTGVRRYSRELVPRPQTKGLVANQSIPRAIFGGFAFQHFGHFLLESLSRVWIEQTQAIDDSVPLVWIGGRGVSIKHWMSDICRQIGLNREVMIIDSSTGALAVEELLVPQASCELHEWIHPEQLRRLGTTNWCPSGSESKVWLSRVGLGASKGGISQEAELESVLVELGWSIFRPEDLPIRDQASRKYFTCGGCRRVGASWARSRERIWWDDRHHPAQRESKFQIGGACRWLGPARV